MESTALTARLPLLASRSRSKPLSPSPCAGARRLASVSFPLDSSRVVLLSRGGEYAGVGSSVFAAAAVSGEAAGAGSEAILLSVQGMMCDGCAASVKRILESQPEVTSATVDFKEARAVVWTTAEARGTEDWQKQCGEKLAKHLGTCGFESRLQE
ncbi:copper-transporting ATPase PAA1, chloroplastic-like isoform X2 [Phragmites australis]|uniref:copper-transporting ATPase PAA1, chloroplastic-like isoform X2 n=1 Tax=Phragmites australis TaxID=29695 RepID=UPI002D77C439|nr:copper-transporting ATPase PAA1, chloroplastic-like isoform X2 [Phragmites australis]